MAKDVEHFLMCLLAILYSCVEISLFRTVFPFFHSICAFDDQFLEFFEYFRDQFSVQCEVGENLFPIL